MPFVPICVVNEEEARLLGGAGMNHKCNSRRHRHYSRVKGDGLVKSGELVGVGKHKKVATFLNARSWVKVYTRNGAEEVVVCGMQLVRGGGGF